MSVILATFGFTNLEKKNSSKFREAKILKFGKVLMNFETFSQHLWKTQRVRDLAEEIYEKIRKKCVSFKIVFLSFHLDGYWFGTRQK